MAYIRQVDEQSATGLVASVHEAARQARGHRQHHPSHERGRKVSADVDAVLRRIDEVAQRLDAGCGEDVGGGREQCETTARRHPTFVACPRLRSGVEQHAGRATAHLRLSAGGLAGACDHPAPCDYAVQLTLAPGSMDQRDVERLRQHRFSPTNRSRSLSMIRRLQLHHTHRSGTGRRARIMDGRAAANSGDAIREQLPGQSPA